MSQTAVIGGVGPGLGESIARRFIEEGCSVGLFARSDSFLDGLADDLSTASGEVIAIPVDITDQDAVEEGFETVRETFGPVDILVNNASAAYWKGLADATADEFTASWEVSALGAFHCSKQAISDMLAGESGTILFSGATSAIRGRGGAVGFSSAKFAVRGLAESMARELGPHGIHIAHVVIDGQILTPDARESAPARDEESFIDPDAIAEAYWYLVEQDRSCWTLELDVRPHVEEF